ncbi:MAG: hypothetical protein D3909_14740, partial [Candidatus Electrothrix sp. ATG1]|nr:hypothetical protein [Candidatus Electrothrix sp. ATG1]
MGYKMALRLIEEAKETGATELSLSMEWLTELPPELFELTNLTRLTIMANTLTELPPELFQLTDLDELDLSMNQLVELPPEICQLTNLTKLYLPANKLTELPPELLQLTSLTELNLGGNQLVELPPEICQLTNLIRIDLGGNHLITLPPAIVQLTNLIRLEFSDNKLTELPPEVSQLTNLAELYIHGNQLTHMPPQITHLPKLKTLWLFDNPLTSPPYELAVQGIEAIREYFASAEEGTRTVSEVKVILVGEGASGKTSLTRCLRDERFNQHEETTHGIRIKNWKLKTGDQGLRCNLWDFGGQEIMHATHQFFLSRRSLYVLVLDGRRDERPEYWLRYIESFGGGSPVLIVLNKYDTNPGFDLNRPFLKKKYPFR